MRKLVLHIGLPKSASSALQVWADANRSALLEQGIDYPPSDHTSIMPKHQGLVGELMNGRNGYLSSLLSRNLGPVTFLSTEGLTNHLYDYPESGLSAFRAASVGFEINLFLMFRPVDEWITSYWKQSLLNPPVPKFAYGTSLTRDEFSDLPRVRRLCNVAKVAHDAREAYGAAKCIIVSQQGDWKLELTQALGLSDGFVEVAGPSHVNISITDDCAEIVRQVNAMALNVELRTAVLAVLQLTVGSRHSSLLRKAVEFNPVQLRLLWEDVAESLGRISPLTGSQARIIADMIDTLAQIKTGMEQT